MDNTLSYSPEIKKGIIRMLMFTLYSDERTIYREYVQNALDSINQAIKENIITRPQDGSVKINIDKHKKTIKIRDNGTGIETGRALSSLLDVSSSIKDGITQAGQYGVGRLVGGGYCHKMFFNTTAKGENQGTQIVFDVDKIWKMIIEDSVDYPASYVLDTCTTKTRFESQEDEHYFEVVLEGVKEDVAPSLLNSNEIISYLNNIAPVEYKPEFKNILIYNGLKEFPEFNTLHENLEKVQLFVNDTRILKQYGLSIHGTGDKINNIEYFKIEDPRFGILGWGWFAMTKFTIQIKEKDDQLLGIRLRKHNIQIGGSDLLSGRTFWKEDRGNSYFYGEFFVTHQNIVPNGARDGLVPTPETNALYKALKNYFEGLTQLYTKANEAKNSIKAIEEGCLRMMDRGVNDVKANDDIDNKGIRKFEKLLNIQSRIIQNMLELYKPSYNEAVSKVNEFRKKNEKSKEEHATQITQNSGNVSEKTKQTGPIDTSGEFREVKEQHESQTNNIVVKEPEGVDSKNSIAPIVFSEDIVAPLKGVLSDEEVWLVRRIFRVLNTNCPNNDKRLIEQLEKMIVKELKG